jgi:hypothetical protein
MRIWANDAGIAVLRLPTRITTADLQAGLTTLVRALEVEPLAGRLGVVERGRVRVHQVMRDT